MGDLGQPLGKGTNFPSFHFRDKMMAGYETKELDGALFRQEDRKGETSPTHSGNCKIDGVDYWISGWMNTAQSSGKKYLSLKFNKKDGQRQTSPIEDTEDDFDDDVPF